MALYNVLLFGLLGLIAYLLSRIVHNQGLQLRADETWRLRLTQEQATAAYLPTLWQDPGYDRAELVTWFTVSRSGDERAHPDWHWFTLAERAKSSATSVGGAVSPSQINELEEQSAEFIRKGESVGLLNELELRFLTFQAWRTHHFQDPTLLHSLSVEQLGDDIRALSQRYVQKHAVHRAHAKR